MPAHALPAAAARPPDTARLDDAIAAVRRFNRFHTRLTGALDEAWQGSGLGLAQVRVLYELAHRDRPAAAELGLALAMDPGYLSRILDGFRRRGLLTTQPAPGDARRRLLRLTPAGRQAFEPLWHAGQQQVGAWLEPLSPKKRRRLLEAMATIERLLAPLAPDPGGDTALPTPAPAHAPLPTAATPAPIVLRAHRPGDLGWVVSRHGALYAQEYGWEESFEGMVAGIVARFVERFDPSCERCWIAERDGERLGSVFVVNDPPGSRVSPDSPDSAVPIRVARLRMLLVEPAARGTGLGRALVRECLQFARVAGYRRMVLATHDVLLAARGIYRSEGFVLVDTAPHPGFGHPLVAEEWARAL